jgi:hypothetical protein
VKSSILSIATKVIFFFRVFYNLPTRFVIEP